MSKIGVGHATFGYGRSRNNVSTLTKISGELVWTMDRSPTEYGGPGRVAHTLARASNMSNFATDTQTPSQPQILLRLQLATLRKSS